MKNILFYGDSNTWGFDPDGGARFPRSVRYTGLLRETLPADYEIIEFGLRGRTTAHADGYDDLTSGVAHLPMTLKTVDPLDLVVIMLGTNDIKTRFGLTIDEITRGMRRLISIVHSPALLSLRQDPRVLVVAPMLLSEQVLADPFFCEMFSERSLRLSRELPAAYEALCTETGCAFFDASQLGPVTGSDGLHMSVADHQRLAEILAQIIPSIV